MLAWGGNSNEVIQHFPITSAEPRGHEDYFCDPIRTPQNGRKECKHRDVVKPESDKVEVETECQFTCNEGRC